MSGTTSRNEQQSTVPGFLSVEVLDNIQLIARHIARELGLRPIRGHFSDIIASENRHEGYSHSL